MKSTLQITSLKVKFGLVFHLLFCLNFHRTDLSKASRALMSTNLTQKKLSICLLNWQMWVNKNVDMGVFFVVWYLAMLMRYLILMNVYKMHCYDVLKKVFLNSKELGVNRTCVRYRVLHMLVFEKLHRSWTNRFCPQLPNFDEKKCKFY